MIRNIALLLALTSLVGCASSGDSEVAASQTEGEHPSIAKQVGTAILGTAMIAGAVAVGIAEAQDQDTKTEMHCTTHDYGDHTSTDCYKE